MNWLKLFFGNPESGHPPQNCPRGEGSSVGPRPVVRAPRAGDDEVTLNISKALRVINFITRSYGLEPVSTNMLALTADLETMLRFGDLTSLHLEIMRRDGRVFFEWPIVFQNGSVSGASLPDSEGGIGLPVLPDPSILKGHRFLVSRARRESEYRHLLKLKWSNAPKIAKAAGGQFESEHQARITGGRQHTVVHVGDEARRQFVVTQTGTRGFGFAKDLDGKYDRVFWLAKHWPPGLECRAGSRCSALLIQTPRGLQLRDIRAA